MLKTCLCPNLITLKENNWMSKFNNKIKLSKNYKRTLENWNLTLKIKNQLCRIIISSK